MSQIDKQIWLDGKFYPYQEANTHLLTHALHYGTGFFEGIRAYKMHDGRSGVFRLPEHCERLINSAKIYGFTVPYSAKELEDAIIATLKINQQEEGYIRPLAFLGPHSMGLLPRDNPMRVMIAVWEWGAILGQEGLEKGVRVQISSFCRHNVNSSMPHAKVTGAYTVNVAAKMAAVRQGYDEAILLDKDGFVAEGAGENIFIVCKNKLITPPPLGILDGITRDTVLTFAEEMGYTIVIQRFSRDYLYTADEAFFAGTAAEIAPIREVDDRIIGNGMRGPITTKIQEAYWKTVRGELSKHINWLTVYEVA